jgi:formyl-CoA transferase
LDTGDIVSDRSLRDSDMIVEVDHPQRGSYLTVGCPVRLSDSPVEIVRSPLLGEHSRDVLETVLGMDSAEVEGLSQQGLI